MSAYLIGEPNDKYYSEAKGKGTPEIKALWKKMNADLKKRKAKKK